jgi:hypothetical protein
MRELSGFTRRRLERIAEAALHEAGVLGVLPTPLEEVQRAAGIVARRDIGALPRELVTTPQPLLGALWYERRTVYVDLAQSQPRLRFTDAHEAMHALCPWHEAVLREDGADELFRATRAAIEAEANFGAGLLIFQGRRFRERVRDEPCSLAGALALAPEHGASRQATVHHYVQQHGGCAALLIAGRFPRRDGSLPVWRSVESPAFHRRYGRAGGQLGGGLAAGTPLRELVEAARITSGTPSTRVRLVGRDGSVRRCVAEAYYNRHTFLVLLADRGATAPSSSDPPRTLLRNPQQVGPGPR